MAANPRYVNLSAEDPTTDSCFVIMLVINFCVVVSTGVLILVTPGQEFTPCTTMHYNLKMLDKTARFIFGKPEVVSGKGLNLETLPLLEILAIVVGIIFVVLILIGYCNIFCTTEEIHFEDENMEDGVEIIDTLEGRLYFVEINDSSEEQTLIQPRN